MARWFKVTLWVIAALLVVGFALYQYLIWSMANSEWNFSGGSDAHWTARADFLSEFDSVDCITRDNIHDAAQANGFESWDVEGDFAWCHSPTGLRDWLGVEVQPSQFMSTLDENTEYFGFDETSCAVVITYDSGPDSTCPD